MKRLSLLLSFVMVLTACAMVRLENQLPKAIRAWYDQHLIIMETKVPKEIDARQPLERDYFLRLPTGLQTLYIQKFWDMREVKMQEEYQLRLAVCARWFRGRGVDGFRTDCGKIMRLCGQPDYADKYDENNEIVISDDEDWLPIGTVRIWVWKYWWGRTQLIDIRFLWHNGKWEYQESMDAIDRDFIDYWRWRMAPTEDGWAMWGSML